MKCNVGKTDRLVRVIIGLIIAVVGATLDSWWGLIGVAVMLSGFFSFCGLYIPLGINTRKTSD